MHACLQTRRTSAKDDGNTIMTNQLPLPTDTRQRTSPKAGRKGVQLALNKQLVLKRWLLQLFGVKDFVELAKNLIPAENDTAKDIEPGQSTYLDGVLACVRNHARVNDDAIRRYDLAILQNWDQVTETGDDNGNRIHMKYFQYLALLFTEIYLDAYFTNAVTLQNELNNIVRQHNITNGTALPEYKAEDLRKLAFWQATGSGKTIIMHVNILQYLRYAQAHDSPSKKLFPDLIILLTPNESLSHQHRDNLLRAGFNNARIFDKVRSAQGVLQSRDNPQSKVIEIIDINKLAKDDGDKTVAVSAFEGNNLVLVDEGHRGSSGQEWMEYRRQLVTNGFSCEYSATFGQAFRASNDPALTAEYAKCIIIDYSYRYFYEDGYGKDFSILNMQKPSSTVSTDQHTDGQFEYLVGSLLTFYQQLRYYDDQREQIREFQIYRPFMIFVGGSVTKSINKDEVSDVVGIIQFLARFTSQQQQAITVQAINRILYDDGYLIDETGKSVFANRFVYLQQRHLSAEAIYQDMLQQIFKTSAPGAITVELLRKASGEIALRIGENDVFGVINVGDAPALLKLIHDSVEASGIRTMESDFNDSLFHSINKPNSSLSMLIGSRKFTEGWSSFRVSCMGLMKIGKNEGTQIIQLFGRGVRLKGYNNTLKRSAVLENANLLGIDRPKHIEILETLNVFGIQANYMAEFNSILTAEDIRTPDKMQKMVISTRTNEFINPHELHVIGLKRDTVAYERTGAAIELAVLDIQQAPRAIHVIRDYYPRLQALHKHTVITSFGDTIDKHNGILTHRHCMFLDFTALYHKLIALKQERKWHNLIITPDNVRALIDPGEKNPTEVKGKWYTLYAPPAAFEFSRMANVDLWQQMAFDLLAAYCEVFYKNRRAAYEADYLVYKSFNSAEVKSDNMIHEYTITVDKTETNLIAAITDIQTQILNATQIHDTRIPNYQLRSLHFDRHLYTPLLALPNTSDAVTVVPTPLNSGEMQFIKDLREYYDKHKDFFTDKPLYVLRNRSRGHGIGFFAAGNFYPDFIVWVIHNNTQYITFVDPKGLVRLHPGDPKILFYKSIKDVEKQLRERSPELDIKLNSCIISVSTHQSLLHWTNKDGTSMCIKDFNDMHVFFQKDQPQDYINLIFTKIGLV